MLNSKYLFIILVLGLMILTSCKSDLCEPPYLEYKSGCCLDKDDSKVCDDLEKPKTSETSEETTESKKDSEISSEMKPPKQPSEKTPVPPIEYQNLIPNKCVLSPGFDFGDCKAATNSLRLSIYNGLGSDTKSTVLRVNTTRGSDVDCHEEWDIGAMANGATSNLHTMCTGTYTEGARFEASVRVIYIKSGKTLDYSITGVISRSVER